MKSLAGNLDMSRVACFAALLSILGTGSSFVWAQTETFDWDGSADNDWFTTTNWTVFGGDPNPSLGDPLVPDLDTRVEIFVDGTGAEPAPIISGGDAEAFELRIGRNTDGLLTINSGTLTTARDTIAIRVGDSAPGTLNFNGGTLNVSGGTLITGNTSSGTGQINMSGGIINIIGSSRDLNMDESPAGNTAGSNLNMTGGEINIGDVFLVDNMASVDLSAGTISTVDDLRIRRSGEVRVSGGLLVTQDDLEFGDSGGTPIDGGSLDIDGGIVRAGDLGDVVGDAAITINGNGLLQFNNAAFSVAEAMNEITDGFITGSSALAVSIVDVDGTDFTQIAVVGSPGDFDDDGDVDGFDFLEWQRGASPSPLSPADLADWQNSYGAPAGSLRALSIIPEPNSKLLLVSFIAISIVQYSRSSQG